LKLENLMPFRKHLPELACLTLLSVLLAACAAPIETPGEKSLPTVAIPYPLDTPIPVPTPVTYPDAPTVNPEAPVSQPANPVAPTPEEQNQPANPYAPRPGDVALAEGEAFVEEAGVVTLESSPPQFRLHLSGTLPTPCHELRVQTQPPDAQNRMDVRVYSVVDPAMICTQVLAAFDASLPLAFPAPGEYIVWVNGKQAGRVTVP
jgi:hypothetical protein